MLRGVPLLAAVLEVIEEAKSGGSLARASSRITRSPEDWPKSSVSWTLELDDLGGQITAWEDGVAELDLVDMVQGDARSEHRQLGDIEDIRGAIETIYVWVVGKPCLADNS